MYCCLSGRMLDISYVMLVSYFLCNVMYLAFLYTNGRLFVVSASSYKYNPDVRRDKSRQHYGDKLPVLGLTAGPHKQNHYIHGVGVVVVVPTFKISTWHGLDLCGRLWALKKALKQKLQVA